ncbi:unnamed protein product [marine sediment metagenome]|uniref:Uncharacterized protein n=1 Tax=marine sediment metagenome TaxID=412755 RepID=X0SJY4_9ZZZZ
MAVEPTYRRGLYTEAEMEQQVWAEMLHRTTPMSDLTTYQPCPHEGTTLQHGTRCQLMHVWEAEPDDRLQAIADAHQEWVRVTEDPSSEPVDCFAAQAKRDALLDALTQEDTPDGS